MKRWKPRRANRQTLLATFRWPDVRRFNLATETVDFWAKTAPHRIALVEPNGRTATYGALSQLSAKWAAALHSIGVVSGERVGILLPQSLDAALAHLAVYRLGAIAVPLSSVLGGDAVSYRLVHSGARFLLASAEAAEANDKDIPGEIQVVTLDTIWKLVEKVEPLFQAFALNPDHPALIMYTSGTTGKPKGAVLPHRALIGHLPAFVMYSNYPSYPAIYWSPADWAWIAGLMDVLLPALYYGFTVIGYRAKRFDPEEALWLMDRFNVTHAFLFPTALKLLRQLGDTRKFNFKLRSVYSGGEPLGEELQVWSQENFGVPVNEIYGQTEANLLVGNSYRVYPIRPGSMGLPFPGHQVVLLREDGGFAVVGELGEIALKTPDPVAFVGYWTDSHATEAKFRGPYLLTGDLAVSDEDGYLWFKGRKDDLIKSAGYRISPAEVEDVLLGHPAVALAGVVGLPDPERGERVAAFVKLRSGYVASPGLAEDLKSAVRSKLGNHAYPRDVYFIEEFPLTATGKIQRFKLRLLAQQEERGGGTWRESGR